MRWVDVPFRRDEDTIYTQQTEWPPYCACCGGDTDGRTDVANGRLDTGQGPGGVQTWFSVGFQVPLCGECGTHAGPTEVIPYVLLASGFGLWVLVGWILFINDMAYDAIGMVLFLASAALLVYAGFKLNRFLVARMSKTKMRADCVSPGYPVAVEPSGENWRLEFRRDDYAEAFAAHNGLVLLTPRG